MKRAFSLIALLLCLCAHAMAATYYVSPTGNDAATGDSAAPWKTLPYALTRLAGGDTLVLTNGSYPGGFVIPAIIKGSVNAPTTIKAETKWKARINGSGQMEHGIDIASGADYVVIDGLEVSGAVGVGIKFYGNYTTVRNCWVHHNCRMGIQSPAVTGSLIERNVVEYNGQHPQFHHGVYVAGTNLQIRCNVIRCNASFGIHCYPSLDDSRIENNLIYGHLYKQGIMLQGGVIPNTVANNTIVQNTGGIFYINPKPGEVLCSNILQVRNGVLGATVVDGTGTLANISADYNVCNPASTTYQGTHGSSASPALVDLNMKQYLTATSVCRDHGCLVHSPLCDFWGRPYPTDIPRSIGAFPYYAYYTTPAAYTSWYSGYPFEYYSDPGQTLPDYWQEPQ